VDKAIGYGVNGMSVDGTDLVGCIQGFRSCIEKARSGEGPQMVIGNLLRLSGHGEHDDAPYISEEMKKSKLGLDCLNKSGKRILDEGWCSQSDIDDMFKDAENEVNAAIKIAGSESAPDPYSHDWSAYSSSKFEQ
jgi:pyruvate dehydrogenase E1 component alpha subunit/2-oxoisovalerate dehydrogenase E1 component alpha subunit